MVYFNHIFGAVTGLIGMFFIARFMAQPDYNYGIVSFAIGFTGLFSFIGSLFGSAHVKRLSEGKDEGECVGTYISLKTASVAVMLACAFGAIMFWKHIMGRGFESQIHQDVVYIMLMVTAMKMVGNIGMTTFQGKSEFAKSEIIRFMDYNIPFIFVIYISLTGGQAIELAYTYMTGAVLMALATLFFFKSVKVTMPTMAMAKSYWNFGLPSLFTRIAGLLGKKVDIVMVQLFSSSVNVGYYGVALKFYSVLTGLSGAVGTIIFPTMSGHHANSRWDSIKTLVTGSTRYLSMIVTPIVIFLIIFPEQIIIIMLSRAFVPAVTVVRLMAITAFLSVVKNPLITVFKGINMPKLGAKLSISCNLLNFGLNILFIPPSIFGFQLMGLKEVGAALATLISTAVLFVLTVYYSNKVANATLYEKIPLHIISGLVTGALLTIVETEIFPLLRFYHLIIYGLAFVGLYTLILYVMGEFTKEDWGYIMDSLHPKEMFTYVRDEAKNR